jgi:hypothetical protein
MDVETATAIEALRSDLRSTEARLAAGTASLGDDLRGEMRQMGDELRGEIQQMGEELRGEMRQIAEDLRRDIREGDAETRRHSTVLVESLRNDIRLVAEAVAVLTVKVDRLS